MNIDEERFCIELERVEGDRFVSHISGEYIDNESSELTLKVGQTWTLNGTMISPEFYRRVWVAIEQQKAFSKDNTSLAFVFGLMIGFGLALVISAVKGGW